MLAYTCFRTEWGHFGLAATERGVCGSFLPIRSQRRAEGLARRRWPDADVDWPEMVRQWRDAGSGRDLRDLQARIKAYFTGRRVHFDVPLDLTGVTDFRRRVLLSCATIGYGSRRTYGDLAEQIGSPGASRAVGGAMAHNPIPLIIPCHRVLAANGRLGGFSAEGGVAVKSRMLRLESV